MSRTRVARLDVVRCPECDACMDLNPLLLAHDLAIVSALLQELGIEEKQSRRMNKFLDTLARKSGDLCTDLGYYGYEALSESEETE